MPTFQVSTSPSLVAVGDAEEMVVKNVGSATVFYKNQASVSSGDTSLAAGATVTIPAGQFFVTAAGTASAVSAKPGGLIGTPIVSKEIAFTEVAVPAAASTYTGSVSLPAGSTLVDIIVSQIALWDDATSASMQIGNADDPDGYYTAINLKATDLLATESINFDKQGGKGGADATVGSSTHIADRYSATAMLITATVATGAGGGSAGRTRVTVVYSLPVSTHVSAATVAAT